MQVFSDDTATDGKKRVNGALRARAAVRPALAAGERIPAGAGPEAGPYCTVR